jgi:hypothetical protein
MTFHQTIRSRLLIRSISSSSTPKAVSSKRSTASGALPPPKLDYEALAHTDQTANAAHRNAPVPDRTFLAIRRDLDAWRTTTRGADDLRAKQARAGEAVRVAKSAEGEFLFAI